MSDLPREEPSKEELERRMAWFEEYSARLDVQPAGLPLRCPCCGCRTLEERGGHGICPVCFWEDDGQDDYDADAVRGGPNGRNSLTHARTNFRQFGACDPRVLSAVRPPRPDELPEPGTTPSAPGGVGIDVVRSVVRELADILARGEYDAVIARCDVSRLTSADLRGVLREYGRTPIEPPGDAFDRLDVVRSNATTQT